jgi:hypothetical protein
MEPRDRKVGRGMGHLMNSVKGESVDIETIIRIRPWIEDEARRIYGYSGKTKLFTDYNSKKETFFFTIQFDNES